MVEDLLNQALFDTFGRWLAARGDEWEGPLVPIAAERQQRFPQRTADGVQVGASTHRAALPPLLPFGLSVDEHFEQSLHLGTQPLQTELHPVLDADLLFAAEIHAKHRGSLRPMRQRGVGALKELKRRWESVAAQRRARQPQALRRATHQRDLRPTALLIILTSWGDVTYAHGLVKGLPAVGFAPPYGVFPTQDAEPISLEDVLGDWHTHNTETIQRLRPGRLDEVLLEQSMADAAQAVPGGGTKAVERTAVQGDTPLRNYAGVRKTSNYRQRSRRGSIGDVGRLKQARALLSSQAGSARAGHH